MRNVYLPSIYNVVYLDNKWCLLAFVYVGEVANLFQRKIYCPIATALSPQPSISAAVAISINSRYQGPYQPVRDYLLAHLHILSRYATQTIT